VVCACCPVPDLLFLLFSQIGETMAGLLLLVLMTLASVQAVPLPLERILTTGAIVTRLQQVPYRDSMVVEFGFLVPNATALAISAPCVNCTWEQKINGLAASVGTLLNDQNKVLVQGRRKKRAFWSIAAAVAPALIEYFPKLVSLFRSKSAAAADETQSVAVVPYKAEIPVSAENLPSTLETIHSSFLALKRKFVTVNVRMNNLENSISTLEKAMRGILQLNNLDQAAAKCALGLLPARLINSSMLADAMGLVQHRLKQFTAELVIPANQLEAYYVVPSATCMANDSVFKIKFRVPIKKMDSTATLYSVHPAPYKVQDVTCYFINKPLQIAIVENHPIFLPQNYCPQDQFFCQVPRDNNPAELDTCLFPLFPVLDPPKDKCKPVCERSQVPVVTEVGPNKFWIVTDDEHPMKIRCHGVETEVENIDAGADLVTLPCDCAVSYSSTLLVSPRILCDEKDVTKLHLERAVPVQWTRRVSFLRFEEIVGTLLAVYPSELRVDGEEDVYVPGEAVLEQPWLQELLAAGGGAVAAAMLTLAMRLLKRYCRCPLQPYSAYLTPRQRRGPPVISAPMSPPPVRVTSPAPPVSPPPALAAEKPTSYLARPRSAIELFGP